MHEYTNYPNVAKKIGKATGGKNGRMPYWFQFSKNQRSEQNNKNKYADPNNSTMNRVCKAFEDIRHINLNYAGVPQFNWQMLLSEPCTTSHPEIPLLFCNLDKADISSMISSQENSYDSERQLINGSTFIAEDIASRIISEYGSLEYAYPYIVKYLFAGEGMNKSVHKQMFWRVFGVIALNNLRTNLASCDTCEECGIKIPSWVKNHQCIKNTKGFYECIDCGLMCERKNATQCRCEVCQETYRKIQKRSRQREKRELQKEIVLRRITRLPLYSTET